MDVHRFLAEMKDRRVYRIAVIYAAGSWALLQVADLFFPMLGLPEQAITTVLAAVALGFPIALILAWFLDITPDGVVETDATDNGLGSLRLSPARLAVVIILTGLVFLVGFLYMDRLDLIGKAEEQQSSTAITAPSETSIAVIPFVNMSDMKELEYFADGLAEEILNLLARLNELDVAARTSSFYFKGRDVGIQEIARHLGVRNVLEGSVRRQGNRVRVTAQLIDASNGYHLWSETYDRDSSDTFDIQDEIARQVVAKLQVILSDSSKKILDQRPALVPRAYDYYLRGREYLRESRGVDSLDQAVTLFTRAIALDDGYAEAYAGLCDSLLGHYRISRDPRNFKSAEKACQNALALDSKVPAVYVALGNLYRFSGENAAAIREFERALKLNPKAVDALIGLAETYEQDNKPERAQELFLQAIQLQPYYWHAYQRMGSFLFSAGRFDEAIPYYQRITEMMPDNAGAFSDLGAVHYMLNQFESAALAMQKSLELAPTAIAYSNAGASLFLLHRFEEAVDMYQKAVEYAPDDFENWGSLGDAYRYSEGLQELAEPMYRNAIKLALESLEVNANDVSTLGLLAHYEANIGNREQALQYLARASALAPKDLYVNYTTATALCALGETEQALAALNLAIRLGYSATLAKADASLCGLTELPGFQVP